MKILVISDIHANCEALKVLVPYFELADKVFCLGDMVGYSCAVNECIDILREHECVCIQGNHERYLIEGVESQIKYLNESVLFGIQYAKEHITEDNYKWLKGLPLSIGHSEEGASILMVHGSPFDPINDYVYAGNTDFSVWKFKYDFILLGHTHRELCNHVGDSVILNPGSVGQARDHEGKACAIMLDTTQRKWTSIHEPYDFMKNLEFSISKGAGQWVYKHYQTVINKQ